MAERNQNNSDKQKPNETPFLEWLVAALGLILVAGTIGFMLYQAFASNNTPPSFTTSIERIDQVNSGYVVVFNLVNTGEQTASSVEIEGELKNGAESMETSGATIDYAPSRSKVKGGLFFKNDPKQFQIEVRAKGYAEP